MIRKSALLLILGVLLLQEAAAFEYPLSSEQVREAYFLGRDVNNRGKFFSRYIHLLKIQEIMLSHGRWHQRRLRIWRMPFIRRVRWQQI
jgi:hypothetical protein